MEAVLLVSVTPSQVIITSYPVTLFSFFQLNTKDLFPGTALSCVGTFITGSGILLSISLTNSTLEIWARFNFSSLPPIPVILSVTCFTAICPPRFTTRVPVSSTLADAPPLAPTAPRRVPPFGAVIGNVIVSFFSP